MHSIAEYEKEVKKIMQAGRVILFGTGGNFRPISTILQEAQIEILAVCDNNTLLYGTSIKIGGVNKGHGELELPVLSVEEVYRRFKRKFPWIITSANEVSIRDMREQLFDMGLEGEIVTGMSVLYYGKMMNNSREKEAISLSEAVILSNVALVVTDYCTLRCQDCQFMIAEKKQHCHYDLDKCVNAVKNLANGVDMIGRLGVTGGEALLYPELEHLLVNLNKIDNILAYEVMTNGATPLTESFAKLLAKYQVRLTISDYGTLSKYKKDMINQSEKYGFPLNLRSRDKTWNRLGDSMKRNRSTVENERVYDLCPFGGGCLTILDGKLGMCGHAAFLIQEGMIPDREEINLLDQSVTIRSEVKKLLSLKYIEACDYCDGIYGEIIAPAIQRHDR